MSPGPTRTHRGDDVKYDETLPDKFQFISSTQHKQFKECHRKWFFSTQLQINTLSTEAMGFGTDVHAVLEDYGKTGVLFDPKTSRVHEVASHALQYLPKWGPDWMPEVNLADPEQGPQLYVGQVPFISYMDLFVPPRVETYEIDERTGIATPCDTTLPLVVDFKTTAALYWAKTAAQLKTDIQGVGYARWGIQKTYAPNWTDSGDLHSAAIQVKFPYLVSKGRGGERSACTDFVITAAEIVPVWKGFERDVDEMLSIAWAAQRGELTEKDVRPNFSSCDNFGGCPHRVRCAAIAKDALSSQLVQLKLKKESEMLVEVPSEVSLVVEPVPAEDGFDLLIDAVPLSGGRSSLLLETYLAELNAQIVLDYNAAKGANFQDVLEFPFGQWKGPLRALLAANPPKGLVVARSQGETTQVALEVLRSLARTVVQGVR